MGAWARAKNILPTSLVRIIRATGTAVITPIKFSVMTGHLRSSFAARAVMPDGAPLPWYTYPCIEFLLTRDFTNCRVLEVGAGQSTLWWASHSHQVVSLEGDQEWYESLQRKVPSNVTLNLVSVESAERCVADVARILRGEKPFDVIVIDGLFRGEVLDLVVPYLRKNGIIICDNSEGYGFFEVLAAHKMERVDFYGFAPGVVKPQCSSIAYRDSAFVFSSKIPIRSPPLDHQYRLP